MSQTHFGYQQVPEAQKVKKVAEVFHSVAAKYDVMNDLMSAGLHRLWKAFTIQQANVREGSRVLDIAGGTADLSIAFAKRVGNERTLTALYLLTVADIRGTSPKVWNAWKGKLLEDLYRYTTRVLGGRAPDAEAEVETRKREALTMLALYALPFDAHKSLWETLDVSYFMRHDAGED
mgnify:CR=1 FL=1